MARPERALLARPFGGGGWGERRQQQQRGGGRRPAGGGGGRPRCHGDRPGVLARRAAPAPPLPAACRRRPATAGLVVVAPLGHELTAEGGPQARRGGGGGGSWRRRRGASPLLRASSHVSYCCCPCAATGSPSRRRGASCCRRRCSGGGGGSSATPAPAAPSSTSSPRHQGSPGTAAPTVSLPKTGWGCAHHHHHRARTCVPILVPCSVQAGGRAAGVGRQGI